MEEKTEKQLKKISKGFWIFFLDVRKTIHVCSQRRGLLLNRMEEVEREGVLWEQENKIKK